MLDLGNLPTSAVMRLAKAVPKRESSSLAWDLDLSMEIPDKEAAEAVDQFVPGALRAYEARESSKGTVKTANGFELARFEMLNLDGDILASGNTDVRGASVMVGASQAVLTLKLRVHGMLQEQAMHVVYQLDEQITIGLLRFQQLSLLPSIEAKNLVGKLIVNRHRGDVVAGLVASQDGQDLEVATMEDAELTALQVRGRPDTVLHVKAEGDRILSDVTRTYVTRCDTANKIPSWNDVIKAIGDRHSAGESDAEDSIWTIDQATWDAAFEMALDMPEEISQSSAV